MTDQLIERIQALSNPTAVGLDTSLDYLPDAMKESCTTLEDAAKAITEFNFTLIDKLKSIVPAVKVQVAYYEMYGVAGWQAFADTLHYAQRSGLIVIADLKRNDIGSTAGCYSAAYLGRTSVNGNEYAPFASDYITVNGYLGEDGIKPFLDDCQKYNKGIFVLVKTSNPSSGQLQNQQLQGGATLYETVGDLVEAWGTSSVGKYGYSNVGAVVGATHPQEAAVLRQRLPHTFFLIPGYGAQGGTAADLAVCFDAHGRGGIVNNSRGIICAHKAERYNGKIFADAAYSAACDMQEDIYKALKMAGKGI
ncbi:orotidine 5'-phosphate decarboxylase [Bacteroidia bacterium]|nr:orotidine 5'-phosphate decarboxylase [Bacteroidia bacterium]